MNENMATYKIGVISDTHGLFRPEVEEQLKSCDVILHAGDIDRPKVMERLREIAPVYAVRGNADREWAEHIPTTRKEDLFGLRIFMIHNIKQISEDISDCDIVIFGHSHKYDQHFQTRYNSSESAADQLQKTWLPGDQLWLNPGSCGPGRFTMPVTMAVIETDGSGEYRVFRTDILHRGTMERGKPSDHSNREQNRDTGYPEGNSPVSDGADPKTGLEREIEKTDGARVASVIRDLNAGKSVSAIAKKNTLSRELAEHICRLYLTHPGIDAEGILDKMDIHNK